MRKNYFMKNVLVAVMLLAGTLTVVSCSGLIDAIVGDVDSPSSTTPAAQPETTVGKVELNSTGATITAGSAAEASSLLATLVDDIKTKGVGNGKEYKIEMAGDGILANSDITINVPKVEGANLNLVFGEAFDAGKTLNINASDVSSQPTKAVNTLVITLSSSADDLCLNVNMPETTVTLKSGGSQINYKDVKSRTALNTMVIDDDVEVKNMEIEGGTVQVNEGGILESWVFAADHNGDQVSITEDGGIEPLKISMGTDESGNPVELWQIAGEDGEPYYAHSLKIAKGDADYSVVWFGNASNSSIPLKTVVVNDDAVLQTNYIAMENIEGEDKGTGVIKYRLTSMPGFTDDTEYGGIKFFEWNSDISGVKNVKRVTFSQPEIVPEEWVKPELQAKIAEGYKMNEPRLNMDVDGDVEDCTFNYNHVFFCNTHSYECPTVSGCKFVHVNHEAELSEYNVNTPDHDIIEFQLPIVYDGSFDSNSITFENCEFSAGTKFFGYFFAGIGKETPDEWFDGGIHFTGYLNFKNCKLGGADFNGADTDFVKDLLAVSGTKIIISFDGTPKYEAVTDSQGGGFVVRPIAKD